MLCFDSCYDSDQRHDPFNSTMSIELSDNLTLSVIALLAPFSARVYNTDEEKRDYQLLQMKYNETWQQMVIIIPKPFLLMCIIYEYI